LTTAREFLDTVGKVWLSGVFRGRELLRLLPCDIGFKCGQEIRRCFSVHYEDRTFLSVVNSIEVSTICIQFRITSREG
jgi:hypothetical protein